jgi:hypothetical protein
MMRCEGRAFLVQLATPVSHLVIDATLPQLFLRAAPGAYRSAIADIVTTSESIRPGQKLTMAAGSRSYGVGGKDARLKWKRKGPKVFIKKKRGR